MNQLLGSLRGQKVYMLHFSAVIIVIFPGSGEQHSVHENGMNKSVKFKATVSILMFLLYYHYYNGRRSAVGPLPII